MGFDLDALAIAVAERGRVARVVVASTQGSSPREAGAAMLVWEGGQSGTIGGGALEFQACHRARALLEQGGDWARLYRNMPLGPELGQCCGGAVGLLTEVFGQEELRSLQELASGAPGLKRRLVGGTPPRGADGGGTRLTRGWLSEGFAEARAPLWIWGAGHVGRALARLLPPLGHAVTWIDMDESRFPDPLPEGTRLLIAPDPADAVSLAPRDARHLIVSHSHALDLDICHRLLAHGFAGAGLIGSATKWARFRKRLAALGHRVEQIDRINCPIGDPALGKSPEAIAVGVASALLRESASPVGQRNQGGVAV